MNFKQYYKNFQGLEFSEPWNRGAWHHGIGCQKAEINGINVVMVTTFSTRPFDYISKVVLDFELEIIVHDNQIEMFKNFKSFKNITFQKCYYGAEGYNFIRTQRVEKFLYEFVNSNIYNDFIRN